MNELDETKTSYLASDMNRNPEGKGGFGERPEDINLSGAWSSKDSISFQYKKFMKMNIREVEDWAKNVNKKDRTVAQDLAYNAVLRSKRSLQDLKEVTDRTEGKSPQTLIHEGGFLATERLLVEIVEPDEDAQDFTEQKTEADD